MENRLETLVKKTQALETELKEIREMIDEHLIDVSMRFMSEYDRELWETLSDEVYRNYYSLLANVLMIREQAESSKDKK